MKSNPLFWLPLFLCGTMLGCEEPPLVEVDWLLYGADVVRPGNSGPASVYIDQGVIVHVGGGDLSRRFKAREEVDLTGKTLVPGFVDAHGHPFLLADSTNHIDLSACVSESDILRVLGESEPTQDAWITAKGWNTKLTGDGASLTVAFPEQPVAVFRVDEHAVWMNAAAQRKLGLPEGTPWVWVDGVEGSGVSELFEGKLPKKAISDEALRASLVSLAKKGITMTHAMGLTAEGVERLRQLDEAQALPVRVVGFWWETVPPGAEPDPLPESGVWRFAMRGVKVVMDGALGSRGAWLSSSYSDAPNVSGGPLTDVDELTRTAKNAHDRGFQVAVHAIGDRGNEEALNLFQRLQRDGKIHSSRHRIEHAQVVHPSDRKRFSEYGVLVSVQPSHLMTDMEWAKARLGAERLGWAYSWKSLKDEGATLLFGSDYPVEPASPLEGIHAAVLRQNREGTPSQGWNPSERLGLEEAFELYTKAGAYGVFLEDKAGAIAPGMWADLVVLDRNPFEVPNADLRSIQVESTWVHGQPVYTTSKPGLGPVKSEGSDATQSARETEDENEPGGTLSDPIVPPKNQAGKVGLEGEPEPQKENSEESQAPGTIMGEPEATDGGELE